MNTNRISLPLAVLALSALLLGSAGFLVRGWLMAGPPPGKADGGVKSAYQRELELGVPKIVEALRASGRASPTTAADVQTLGAALLNEGYKRLEDLVLLDLLSMRSAMAEVADEPFCAALWTADSLRDMAAAPILYLSNERQRRLAQLMVAAELAEIQDRPAKRDPPAADELKAALDKLLGGLGEEDAGFLLAAIKSPSHMVVRDQCKAARLYYRRLKEMAPKDALVVFRSSLYAGERPSPPPPP